MEQTWLRIISTEYAYKDKLISKNEMKQSVTQSLASLQRSLLSSGYENKDIGAQSAWETQSTPNYIAVGSDGTIYDFSEI